MDPADLNPAAPPARSDVRALVMVAAAAASWGLWSLFVRPTELPASVTAPLVCVVIGLASLALVPFERIAPRWDRVTVALLAANTFLDGVNLLTFFGAMEKTTVAVAVLTHYLAPILVALGAPFIERVRVRGALVAAVVATAGLAVILAPWRPENRAGDVGLGALLGAASAVAYAGNVFVVRRLAPRIGAARTMAYHSLLAALVLLPLAAGELASVEAGDLGLLALGSLTIGAGSGILFVRGLPRIGSARASVLTFFEPVVAVLVGWLIWGESLGILALAGGALILGAGLWVARAAAAAPAR